VAALLAKAGVPSAFVGITTRGDVDNRELTEIGGSGVFVSAVRDALVEGRIDVAVHSFKDLPTAAVEELLLAAVPAREDARDVLVGCRLSELTDGSRIGTGAPRRAVQLADLGARMGVRLEIVPIRGNVDSRIALARRGVCDAVVLAAAGLRRLGHLSAASAESDGAESNTAATDRADSDRTNSGRTNSGRVGSGRTNSNRTNSGRADSGRDSDSVDTTVRGLPATVIAEGELLPAPAQGALALEIHASLAPALRQAIAALDDPTARAEALAERGFLAALEAGCTAPVGARAHVKSVRGARLDLTLAAVIGKTYSSNFSEPGQTESDSPESPLRVQRSGSTDDPYGFGQTVAAQVLARLQRTTRSS